MVTTRSIVKRWSTAILFAGIVFLGGCARLIENWSVSRHDGEIRRAGQAIAAARNDTQRSAAYADRADAYSEKARYMRLMKMTGGEEYEKLFDLAMQDYNQAMALNPDNMEIYYRRGNAYYSRASLDMIYDPTPSASLIPAKADFSRVVEKNPKDAMALDMLGLTDGSMGDWTQALAAFEQEWRRVVVARGGRAFSALPAITVQPSSGGITVIARYITRAPEWRDVRARLYGDIVELLQKAQTHAVSANVSDSKSALAAARIT